MTHAYFIAKAAAAFLAADGDPAVSGPLAEWAEAHRDDNTVQGVIVAVDGEIMAETWRSRDRVGATYVTEEGVQRWGLTDGNEVGIAVGRIHRASGKACVHVKWSEICVGAAEFIRADALAYAKTVVREHDATQR